MTGLPTTLLDCRWLPYSGAGRATELLLKGLAQRRPEGRWLLWGPPRIAELAWPEAKVVVTTMDPRALCAQRSWFSIPACDLAVFLHQNRPLRRVRSVTVVYDTIPLRFSGNLLSRRLKWLFLRRVAAISREILTITEFTRTCIQRDLRVPGGRVTVATPPIDEEFADRVLALRRRVATDPVALFVGRFAPHKNLPRLISAFERTRFCRYGGRLVMVGATAAERRQLSGELTARQRCFVELLERCSQPDLDWLFATASFLVQPSLEEGFGLPVWEAMSCGLPVCVSDGGALPEVTHGLADPFPATSTEAMTNAIDECADRAGEDDGQAMRVSEELRRRAPTVGDFADQFVAVVMRHLP